MLEVGSDVIEGQHMVIQGRPESFQRSTTLSAQGLQEVNVTFDTFAGVLKGLSAESW